MPASEIREKISFAIASAERHCSSREACRRLEKEREREREKRGKHQREKRGKKKKSQDAGMNVTMSIEQRRVIREHPMFELSNVITCS
jgi:hypothetical protein